MAAADPPRAEHHETDTPPPIPASTVANIEGDNDDDVEKIVGHRVKAGVLQMQVRWRGYGPEDDEFFPFDHILQDFPEQVRNYVEVHPELQDAYERGDFDTELDS